MALDIFFTEDIRNALLAANEGGAAPVVVVAEALGDLNGCGPGQVGVLMRVYQEGYQAALITLALAFGLAPQAVVTGWEVAAEPVEVVEETALQRT